MTSFQVAPSQVGASIVAAMWFLYVPGYFHPEQTFQELFGNNPTNNADILNILVTSGYCIFWALTCAFSAAEAKAARIVLLVQFLMSIFYVHFYYAVAPGLGALTEQSLKSSLQAWFIGVVICGVSLGLDAKAREGKAADMFSCHRVAPAQFATAIWSLAWFMYVPGYFHPEQTFKEYMGRDPTNIDVFFYCRALYPQNFKRPYENTL